MMMYNDLEDSFLAHRAALAVDTVTMPARSVLAKGSAKGLQLRECGLRRRLSALSAARIVARAEKRPSLLDTIEQLPSFGRGGELPELASPDVGLLQAALLASRHVSGDEFDVEDMIDDIRDLTKRVMRRKEELAAKVQEGMAHEVLEALNKPFEGSISVKRTAEEIAKLDFWLPHRLPDTLEASYLVCSVVALDALRRLDVPSEAVGFVGAPMQMALKTCVMGEDLPGLESVVEVGLPWFFAADCPGQLVPLSDRDVVYRLLDGMCAVAMEEKKYTEALEACRLLASVSPSWDILKDVGCCLVDDPDSSSEDGAKFLKAYLEGADETDKKTADYQEAKDVLAKTNL